MTKASIAFLICGIVGIGCLIGFGLIGSTIDEQGFLHEPFGLLPIGYFLILIGFCGIVFQFFKQKIKHQSVDGEA